MQVQSTFGLARGHGANAFELWDATGVYWQPVALNGLWPGDPSGATVQLNFTWTFPDTPPAVLRHGWHDYPAILVYGAGGLPAGPFNVSVTADPFNVCEAESL